MLPPMAAILIQQQNPDGTLHAIVDDDERCVTLWLVPAEPLRGKVPIRAVWVRNLVEAPERFAPSPAREGDAPLQPATHCVDPGPGRALSPDGLALVWLQEGDGVALLDGDDVLAVLPAWADGQACPGYAAAARGRGPMAWSLADATALVDRVHADRAWWDRWQQDPFTPVRDAQLEAIQAQIGPMQRYFAIDGGTSPPRGMALLDRPPGRVAITLANALRRQPQAELHLREGTPGTRFELAIALHPSVSDEAPWMRALSGLAPLPWERLTWLGSGHTVSMGSLPDPFGAIFLHPAPPPGIELELPDIDGEPVLVLWATPITAGERAIAQQYGRDVLAERLGEALSQCMVRAPVG